MRKVSLDLENCFGIYKLKHEINFNDNNVALIYAQNGVMKTSFTNTFLCIQKGKEGDIKDKIFGKTPIKHTIQIDSIDINKDDIFVIESLNMKYETNSLNDLLINEKLKSKLQNIIENKNNLINVLAQKSGLKKDEVEKTLINDFGWENNNFLSNLKYLIDVPKISVNSILYSDILAVKDYILKKDFQDNIQKYIEEMNNLFCNKNFHYLEKGVFSVGNIKSLQKDLNKNSFFKKEGNEIIIGGEKMGEKELINTINLIDEEIKGSKSYSAISKLLSKSEKGVKFMNILENNTHIIPYLMVDKIQELWISLRLSYSIEIRNEIENLKNNYDNIVKEISDNTYDSKFDEALDIFNDRFHVPFSMGIDNKSDIIFGISSVPQANFVFYKDGNKENKTDVNTVKIERKELDEKNVLSKGEERALYLLNVILDIEKLKKEGNEKLIIIDDIADSFDYKNKYAIIEYLREISSYELGGKKLFNLIILTHNFDFFRNIQSRLGVIEDLCFISNFGENKIEIEKFDYFEPYNDWKKNLSEEDIIALIPFVRNIIKFGSNDSSDEMLLNHILHIKSAEDNIKGTKDILFSDIECIYKKYLGIKGFLNIKKSNKIIDSLYDICEKIVYNKSCGLKEKILLSVGIRLKIEEFLIKNINNDNFVKSIKRNQTKKLIDKYKNKCSPIDKKERNILDSVSIMTPENIHLNSFMYEPLIDMGIDELSCLYNKVNNLLLKQE